MVIVQWWSIEEIKDKFKHLANRSFVHFWINSALNANLHPGSLAVDSDLQIWHEVSSTYVEPTLKK